MITEDYVSSETAKLLKEKGFNEKSKYVYVYTGKRISSPVFMEGESFVDNKNIYKPRKDDSSKVRQIKRGIRYKDDTGIIPASQQFDSYEEAVEAVINYCLENLI